MYLRYAIQSMGESPKGFNLASLFGDNVSLTVALNADADAVWLRSSLLRTSSRLSRLLFDCGGGNSRLDILSVN